MRVRGRARSGETEGAGVASGRLDGRVAKQRFRKTTNERTERTRSEMPTDAIQCKPLEVAVGDKGIERAIKHLKRKMAAEGILRELKRRRHYMKPSVKRRKKASEAARRRRKRSKMDVVQ